MRLPFADISTYTSCPTVSPTKPLVMLADILPTSYEVGVLNGRSNRLTSWSSSEPVRSGWPRS